MFEADVNVRRFGGAEDLRAMQRVSAESWRLDPRLVQLTVGELAWSAYQHVGRDDDWERAVWYDYGDPVAWAWITRPGSLEWQVRPDRPDTAEHVVAWFDEKAEAAQWHVEVRAANTAGREALLQRGGPSSRLSPLASNERELPERDGTRGRTDPTSTASSSHRTARSPHMRSAGSTDPTEPASSSPSARTRSTAGAVSQRRCPTMRCSGSATQAPRQGSSAAGAMTTTRRRSASTSRSASVN